MPRDAHGAGLPPHLDPRRATADHGPTRRRRAPRALVGGIRLLAGLLSFSLLVGAGMATSLVNQFNSASGTGQSVGDLDGNTDGAGVDGEDMNLLIVGTDNRAGYTDEQLQQQLSTTGDNGMNTDTMMLVHVPANGAKASVVSFPRDSLVPIPGFKHGKLNGAFADGYVYGAPEGAPEQQKQDAGQAQLVRTISTLSGLRIDHYVEVTLLGFFRLTEALDGVEVDLCAPASDPDYTGINLPAGKQTLNGKDALSFVRQRHGVPELGDLGRIKRQQYFIGAVIRKLLDQNLLDLLNYAKLQKLVDSLSGVITWDQDLDVFSLAEQMRNIAAGNVEFRTIPLDPEPIQTIDGSSVVVLADDAAIKGFFQDLNDPPAAAAPASPALAPADVTVDVRNSSGTAGLASTTSTQLTELGFGTGTLDNGEVTDSTTIDYPEGAEAQADLLLAQVPGATLRTDAALSGRIRLTIGTGFDGLVGGGSSGGTPPAGSGQGSAAPDQTAASAGCID